MICRPNPNLLIVNAVVAETRDEAMALILPNLQTSDGVKCQVLALGRRPTGPSGGTENRSAPGYFWPSELTTKLLAE